MTSTVRPGSSAGLKFFAGMVSGLSAAMITSSLLYLLWFIPLGRPGSHVPTVEQIIPTLQVAGDTRTPEQLRQAAESSHAWAASMSKVYSVLEILILTSTCLVAAYFASLYGREHDEGEGRPVGTLLQPTLIGTAAGAVVLWALFYSLVARPGEAHPSAHGGATPEAHASAGPAHGIADHGSQPPVSLPRAEAEHAEGAPQDFSAWLAENVHPAELASFLIGTLAAAAVGVLAPRGAAKQTAAAANANGHSYMPGH